MRISAWSYALQGLGGRNASQGRRACQSSKKWGYGKFSFVSGINPFSLVITCLCK